MTDTTLERRLRVTTEEMANRASVPMELWNRHSNACLEAASTIPRLTADNKALTAGETAYKAMLAQAEDDFRKAEAKLAKVGENAERWKAMSQQATSVIRMIRAMIGEMFGPVIESEEATLLRGPEAKHDGEAILEALQKIADHRDRLSAELAEARSQLHDIAWLNRSRDQLQEAARSFLTSKDASQ